MNSNGVGLRNKKKDARRTTRARSREPEGDDGPRKSRSKRVRTTVLIASVLLVLTVSVFIWRTSTTAPPDTGQQPGLETPKAVILDGLFSESPNFAFSQSLTNYLSAAGYVVDNVRGESVTIGLLSNISGYRVIVLRLHSTLDSLKNLYIFSGEPYTESKYTMEQLTGSVKKANTTQGKMYFAINIFLLGVNTADSLKDATVILMGCNGTDDAYSINRLFERGVKTYFGWTGYVDLSHTDQATLTLVKALCLERLSPEQAVQKTMTEVGPDPEYQTVYEYRIRQQ